MKIRCPKCNKIHDIENLEVGNKVECSCSYKFVINDQNITQYINGAEEPMPGKNEIDQKIFTFENDEYDFSRCICKSCGKRLNIEELTPGERFECPFCKAANVVGQNATNDIQQNSRTTSATITDGGHAYAENKNNDGSIPEIIGGCRIEKVLGEGGMGRVYLARHSNLDILVALKTMLPGFSSIKSYAERFYREARTAAKINHPNVVRVYDCGNEQETLFIVMEYVSGGSTGDLLKKETKLSSKTIINIADNMCRALVEAQKFGIIHRDIKPDNIMCGEDGIYKLADLGLAKQISQDNTDISLTMESTGMGTPLYMPPEQSVDAKSCDIRSDIYALGATLYHLACGKPPFEAASQLTLFKMHSEKIPDRPRDLNTDIPEGLEIIIGKCMGKTPDARYQNPKEILEDLERLHNGKKIRPLTPPGPASTEKSEQKSEKHSRKFLSMPLILGIICLPLIIILLLFLSQMGADLFNSNNKKITSQSTTKTITHLKTVATELPQSLRKSLVLFYNFNNTEKKEKVLDLSGNFHNGEISGAKRVKTKAFGKSLKFDGKNDYVNCGPLPVLAKGSITLSAWIKSDQTSSQQRWIMSRSKWGKGAWQLTTHHGKAGVEFGPGGQLLAKTNITDNKWHHILGFYNSENNERRIYIDGELEVFTKDKPAFKEKNGDILLGIRDGANDFFKGMIDNVMIFHRVLNDDEIKKLSKIKNPVIKSAGKNKFKLIVQTKTSFRRNSGTRSPVYILINGENDLKRKIPEALRSKALQTFEFDYDFPIEKIKNIKIEIDGRDAWGVANISFQIIKGNQKSEIKSVGGAYFSRGRESGAKASNSKTYEFKPVLQKHLPKNNKESKQKIPPSKLTLQEGSDSDDVKHNTDKIKLSSLTFNDLGTVKLKSGTLEPMKVGGSLFKDDLRCKWDAEFPSLLAKTIYSQSFSKHQGVIDFKVLTDGIILIAVSTRWGGGGNSSGDWKRSCMSKLQMKDVGWEEVGVIYTHPYFKLILFARKCKKGERFEIRTEKYVAPVVFALADQLVNNHDTIKKTKNKLKKEERPLKSFEILLEAIALDIIYARLDAAKKKNLKLLKIDTRIHKATCLKISSQIDLLNHFEKLVPTMLMNKIGKNAGCLGDQYKDYSIKEVTKDKITIIKMDTKVIIKKIIYINKLSSLQKASLIAVKSKSTAYIYIGLYEFRKKNYTKAKKYFKKAGPLSEALIKQVSEKT